MKKKRSLESYLFYLLFLICSSSFAQHDVTKEKYNIHKKRLLIQNCSMYLFAADQGAIDSDSAVALACKTYKLDIPLSYDEGYNDGSYLIGNDLIAKGDITAAKNLLVQAKGIDKIKLLLQLGGFYLFKPGTKPEDLQNAKKHIDQALQVSNNANAQKWKNQSLLLLAKYYAQAGNSIESQKYFAQVVSQCRKNGNKLELAQALENQTMYLVETDPQKEKILKESNSLYRLLHLQEKIISTDLKIENIHFWSGKMALAKKEQIQVIADQRKIGFKHNQYLQTALSFINQMQLNSKDALDYALQSIKTMQALNDYSFAGVFYRRLGSVYNSLGHYDDAIEQYKKSIALEEQNMKNGNAYKSFIDLVEALSLQGKNKEALDYLNSIIAEYPPKTTFYKCFINLSKANCYLGLKNYKMAAKYYKEMEFYALQLKNHENERDLADCYISLSYFYAINNQGVKAKFYTDKAGKIIQEKKVDYLPQKYQYALFKIDSLSGNHLSAMNHYQNYKKICDSINSSSQSRQIEELKIQYETLNKEQKIKMLDKQSILKESELSKSKLLNNLSIWSLALLLIIIALLYNRYRIKQRNNEKLEIKEKGINQKNVNLSHLLEEKEWLVKEIHHRVKNNLQTVISLLSSQSAYLDNDKALSAIKNSQNRIHSMSLIHQKLYSGDNISTINMPNYIKELVEYLKDSFAIKQRILFDLKIYPLELDVTQAVPLSLILNEAITNSIKYAFPNHDDAIISITLEKAPNDRYLLKIADNGIGIDLQASDQRANSFGMSLIKGLCDDLEAELTILQNNGTILKIEFLPEFQITRYRQR